MDLFLLFFVPDLHDFLGFIFSILLWLLDNLQLLVVLGNVENVRFTVFRENHFDLTIIFKLLTFESDRTGRQERIVMEFVIVFYNFLSCEESFDLLDDFIGRLDHGFDKRLSSGFLMKGVSAQHILMSFVF